MVHQELRDFIARSRHAGQSDEQIASALAGNGWEQADIAAGLSEGHGPVPTPVNLPLVSYEQAAGPLVLLTLGTIIPVAVIEVFAYITRRGSWLSPIMEVVAAVIGIIAAFFTLWFGLSIAFYVSRISEGVNAAMSRALRRIHSYLWIVVLIELIVQFGNVLFIIPGIVFAVWFSFSAFVLSQEDSRGLDALLRSKEYVRGKWWRVFGTLLALGLGFVVIMVVCVVTAHLAESRSVILTAYTALGILTLLYYPFAIVRFYNLFANIKNEKGVVALPAKGRTMFTVFASVGVVIVIGLVLVATFAGYRSAREPRNDGMKQQPYGQMQDPYQPYRQHGQPMIPAPGYQPNIQTQ